MKNLFKKFIKISLFAIVFFNLSTKVIYAQCPVCTIAVGAGLGLSRYLGIDDLVAGVWLGGFLTSFSLMTANWLYKKDFFKKIKKLYLDIGCYFLSALLIFVPLDIAGITGHPFNKILGIDKLIVGSFIGTLVFFAAIYLDKRVRKIRGKQLFNFQKVVFPVTLIAIVSLIFYFITR